ncbi:carbamoyltransferase HypF [Cohnella faecalis]|uniref:carbamoyltransferase HypF n=1 Tax=Cohnella faecalis TaxID=2315694 RepID=UPI001F265090|nr:carbamoyltransferase HypF [Cohnella faecalis]
MLGTGMGQELRTYRIKGIVQGVGFRPFVYRLAEKYGLGGWVLNDSDGVIAEVQGTGSLLDQFAHEVRHKAPALALVNEVVLVDQVAVTAGKYDSFRILESERKQDRETLISPDTNVCEDCLRELFDPSDRRHGYPFINCTNCGPRFSIVRDIPYDRQYTTMSAFPMCEECSSEYEDVRDRRFHAQPNACWACGPQVKLFDKQRRAIPDGEPIGRAAELLKQGAIIAVKGLGGYHLVADPLNESAVEELRKRKKRDGKPFALMAETAEQARLFAEVSEEEERLLSSKERPIVLLRRRESDPFHPEVAPNNRFYGVMLAYTPLHHLLLRDRFSALIATSANLSDEPIVYKDEDAFEKLSGIADYFLVHNRDIHIRVDDSIVRYDREAPGGGQTAIIRRARGFAPLPVDFHHRLPSALGLGAELKNTVCLSKHNRFFVSQHIGDLKNHNVYQSYVRMIGHFRKLLQIDPEVIACDAHPDFYSTQFAESQRDLPIVRVQHHHAHLAACMCENGLEEPVIGVIFDGTGYGSDGKIWGGEFLVGDYLGFERKAHLDYFALPGGDKAVKEPYRIAIGLLAELYGDDIKGLHLPLVKELDPFELSVLSRMATRQVNSPLTSSMGRLFDAVSALIGIRRTILYEGQAAIELEQIIDESAANSQRFRYRLIRDNDGIGIDFRPLFGELVALLESESINPGN